MELSTVVLPAVAVRATGACAFTVAVAAIPSVFTTLNLRVPQLLLGISALAVSVSEKTSPAGMV